MEGKGGDIVAPLPLAGWLETVTFVTALYSDDDDDDDDNDDDSSLDDDSTPSATFPDAALSGEEGGVSGAVTCDPVDDNEEEKEAEEEEDEEEEEEEEERREDTLLRGITPFGQANVSSSSTSRPRKCRSGNWKTKPTLLMRSSTDAKRWGAAEVVEEEGKGAWGGRTGESGREEEAVEDENDNDDNDDDDDDDDDNDDDSSFVKTIPPDVSCNKPARSCNRVVLPLPLRPTNIPSLFFGR